MTDGLSPTEEAMLAVRGDQVKVGEVDADPRITNTKRQAGEFNTLAVDRAARTGQDLAPTVENAAGLRLYDTSGDGIPIKYAVSESDTAANFMRGYNGEYRSVMEGEAPLAETLGRYAGAAVDSFKNFWDAMTGAGSMRNAMASWQRGDIGLSLVQGGLAFAEAGSTVFSFGTTGAIRSVGTATLRAEASAGADVLTVENVGRLEGVANPLPSDGYFSRVMPRKYAEAFARGEGSLGGGSEVFVGAAEDLSSVATAGQAQQRLSLYKNFEGTIPNTSGDTIVQFRLNDLTGLATPYETSLAPRGYGFVTGGRTAGDAREFIIQSGTAQDIGAHSIRLIYLGK